MARARRLRRQRPSRIHRATRRFQREARALGGRVRRFRHRKNWTLEETAERCDLSWKHLQKIEGGALNPTLVTLVRLSVGFRLPLRSFFG